MTTILQQLADVATKDDIAELRDKLRGDITRLDKKLGELLEDHDQRVTRFAATGPWGADLYRSLSDVIST